MQRYHAGSSTSAVNNSTIGGPSARDIGRIDSSSLPTAFPVSSRRQPPLNLYKLKCDKEPLNSRLGPPDFNPQTPNCPEETLTKEYLLSGYRDTVEGLEEAREILLTQIPHFNKTIVLNCKEAIRKRLRAINESRVQKRKAGQVYGVALSGSQLSKSSVFPEQRPCPEDFRKKWIEGLSQQHKRLRSLADLVPQYRRKSVLEVLIRNNVPLLRATWFVKVTYLNLVRPGSASVPSGTNDKTQLSCSEFWTKDIIEYLQTLLDDFFSKSTSHSTLHNRDRSPQMPYTASLKHRTNQLLPVSDGEEPSLHFKWWYVVRLLQWHHAEGLLLPSVVIDWVLHQLQEKQLLEIWQLLLPIVYGFLEIVVLSQTYVRTLTGVALRIIRDPAPGGSDLVDNSRRAYTAAALIEMLRYLILAVPETFVALDCFPLPSSVVSHANNDGNFVPKAIEAAEKIKNSSDVVCIFKSKGLDARYESLAFDRVIACIRKHAENLTKAVSPGYPGDCLAKAAQALDNSLVLGDIREAYKFLFEDLYEGPATDAWVAKVSPCLRLSLKWFVNVNTSLIYSVFFLCEWATCDFRNFRTAPPCDIKFTGKKDMSQVHIAVRLLKMKLRNMQTFSRKKNGSTHHGVTYLAKCSSQQNNWNIGSKIKCSSKSMNQGICSSVAFESPGPLHDIIVCWIDQHVVHKGEGLKRLHLFIVELIRAGIFYPLAYVRQLIVSGIMDTSVNMVDLERQKRHCRILKQLPGKFIHHALEESEIIEGPLLIEALHVYLNERRLILRGSFSENHDNGSGANNSDVNKKHCSSSTKDRSSTVSIDQRKTVSLNKISYKVEKDDTSVEDLKTVISVLLQLPKSLFNFTTTGLDESQVSVKRPTRCRSKIDVTEATPGCEECRRAKKQKLSEEKSSFVQAHFSVLTDDEDTWWVKKGLKSLEPPKVDQPLKTTKQVTKSRQKTVRKTQSLAQLAASRVEGSQGASTSHICDNKVICPHHRTAMDGDTEKSVDGIRTGPCGDIVSTGRALKRLRFVEKKQITVWLMTLIRQIIEDTEKSIGKVGQFGRPVATVDDKSSIRWKFGEDELSAILYLMDVSDDLVPAIKFLLWLLPKVSSNPNSTINSGRNASMLQRNVDNQVCNVGEAFLLSSLRRYENILATADLIPEILSSIMHRAAAIIASNGRVSGSGALAFARYLLKKYSNVVSVVEWEKNFKTTCDKRLASELESGGRLVNGEFGLPLGVPAGIEDPDDYFRQKISGGRLPSRVGSGMRDVVQRNVEDAFHYLFGKDRKLFAAGAPKVPSLEKWDSGYQIAQQIVMGLMDCIRQTGGAAQEGDPSLVTSAVSAIVGSVGPSLAKLPDFSAGNNHPNISLATSSLNYAKCILRMHITCLCLLKEALGERQSRVFDIALATEASNALAGVFAPNKASRNQFQPETHDTSATMSNDVVNSSSKIVLARTTKIAASVSALIVGAVIYGVTSLERMVTILRLKEGLDVIQFVRSSRSNSNGNARSVGAIKVESSVEVHLHWFRLLVGNCRTICEGLVVDLLSEPSIVALSRMQRMLPLSLVFPPAYSIFAFVMWRPFIMNANAVIREDTNQLYQTLTMAINDALKHLPFRDACLSSVSLFFLRGARDNHAPPPSHLFPLRSGEMAGTSNGRHGKNPVFPKTEDDDFDYDLSPYDTLSKGFGNHQETAASSSGSKLRSFFIGMGFLPGLVDKVIEENGEENSDALLEILLRCSTNGDSSDSLEGSLNTRERRSIPNIFPNAHSKEALQKSNSESSDSLERLFDDNDSPEVSTVNQPKEEPDEFNEAFEDKRGTLLMMNFSVEEVEFAIRKLGNKASVPELVDFIFAAQIAKKMKKEEADEDEITCYVREKEISNDKLFGIMEKTLLLFEMGFSENEISSAVDKLGPDVPISELANFIFAEQNGVEYVMPYKYRPAYSWIKEEIKEEEQSDWYGTAEMKVEDFSHEPSQSRQVNLEGTGTGTGTGERVKEEDYIDEFPDDVKYSDLMENDRNKRPKYEYDDNSNSSLVPYWMEEKVDTVVATMSRRNQNPSRRLSDVAAKPPFFLFGNVSNIAYESWKKMSQFLYGIEPEFVNTEFFSAMNRIEGYIHNLPTENRFHILPKPPLTIEDAIPRSKKWWPPWDSRKQLNCNYCETGGINQLCDRLGRVLTDSGGVLTSQQQKDILRYCRGLNLVWTGKYKLGPIEPELLERILGYPLNHTQSAECDLTERLQLLKYCFQTDTLGYHLSVLKPIFPDGLTLLSIFSGIGGAEVSLHRLGIKIKGLVSVETSATKRKILEKWWRSSGQTGTLVQIEDIQKLTSKKFENLLSKLGVFDLVIYQNPCSQPITRPQGVGSLSAIEFSVFCESVRVLQRVRALCERR